MPYTKNYFIYKAGVWEILVFSRRRYKGRGSQVEKWSVAGCCSVYCSVLQCVAVCCFMLQCVAVRCSAVQCVVVPHICLRQHTATHCNTLQHTTTHYNTLQHAATHGNTLQQTEHFYRMTDRRWHRWELPCQPTRARACGWLARRYSYEYVCI